MKPAFRRRKKLSDVNSKERMNYTGRCRDADQIHLKKNGHVFTADVIRCAF